MCRSQLWLQHALRPSTQYGALWRAGGSVACQRSQSLSQFDSIYRFVQYAVKTARFSCHILSLYGYKVSLRPDLVLPLSSLSLSCNGSPVSHLTAAKFKPRIFCVLGFAWSYIAYIWVAWLCLWYKQTYPLLACRWTVHSLGCWEL
jgi:hypothetical protein